MIVTPFVRIAYSRINLKKNMGESVTNTYTTKQTHKLTHTHTYFKTNSINLERLEIFIYYLMIRFYVYNYYFLHMVSTDKRTKKQTKV